MALQEFMASYAVEVDESGAARLQTLLEENRAMADALADAFSAARAALESVFSSVDMNASLDALHNLQREAETPVIVPLLLNTEEADAAAQSFISRLEAMRPMLRVNTSGITTAVSSAVSQIRAMLASLQITVPVTAKVTLDTSGTGTGAGSVTSASDASGTGTSGAAASGTGASGTLPASGNLAALTGGGSASGTSGSSASARVTSSPMAMPMAQGGRVASPSLALIAEEGEPEYVIPVRNDARAVPLLRALLRELSDSARGAILSSMPSPDRTASGETPGIPLGALFSLPVALSGVTDAAQTLFSSASSAATPASSTRSVQAPVTIHVNAASGSAEAAGQSVYHVAERYLLRTLQEALS